MHPKVAYLKTLVIEEDLKDLDRRLRRALRRSRTAAPFKLLRDIFVVIDNLRDLLRNAAGLLDDTQLVRQKRRLHAHFEHVTRLRDKIGGHLDDKVLEAVVCEEPVLFATTIRPKAQHFLTAIRLVDMALNTYLGHDGKPAIFGHDTDIVYPPDYEQFLNWLECVVVPSIELARAIREHLDTRIIRVESTAELMNQYMAAGLGTFKP